MRDVTTTVYKFDELTDAAKEKARDWYRAGDTAFDDYGTENVYSDADTIAKILGIEIDRKPVPLMNGRTRYDPAIYYSGFYNQGDGACFEGRYAYAKGASKVIRQHAPQDSELHRIADTLQALQCRNFYRLEARATHSGRYYHAHSMSIDVTDSVTGNDIANDDTSEELRQILRDFANWIYHQLKHEYEYVNSDECVDENIRINEYEFDVDGNRNVID